MINLSSLVLPLVRSEGTPLELLRNATEEGAGVFKNVIATSHCIHVAGDIRLVISTEKNAIVVLGVGISDQVRRDRAEAAAGLFLEGAAKLIIVSGGITGSSNVSEARAMKECIESIGIPTEAILQEEYSKTTMGNAYYTKKMFLEPRGLRKIVLVTSSFHRKRTLLVFKKVLGPKYDIQCVQVNDRNVSPGILRREGLLFLASCLLLKRIRDGEDERIMAIARNLRLE